MVQWLPGRFSVFFSTTPAGIWPWECGCVICGCVHWVSMSATLGYGIWVCAYVSQTSGHHLLITPGGATREVVWDLGLRTGGESDRTWALTGRGLADGITWLACTVRDNSSITFTLSTSSRWTHFDHKTENTADEHRYINPPSYLLRHWYSIYVDFRGSLFFCFSVWRVLFGVFFFWRGDSSVGTTLCGEGAPGPAMLVMDRVSVCSLMYCSCLLHPYHHVRPPIPLHHQMNSPDNVFAPQPRKYLFSLYLSEWFPFSPSKDGDWFVILIPYHCWSKMDWNHPQRKILNEPNS
jgi:hypothetical protein